MNFDEVLIKNVNLFYDSSEGKVEDDNGAAGFIHVNC